MLQQKTLTTEQHKWTEKIAVTDALSRKDEEVQVFVVSMAIPEWLDGIRTEYAKNPETCAIINDVNQYPKFEWKNDILWYKGRICLNPNSRFKSKFVQESHDCPGASHVGFFKTYYNVHKSFF